MRLNYLKLFPILTFHFEVPVKTEPTHGPLEKAAVREPTGIILTYVRQNLQNQLIFVRHCDHF